MFMARFVIASSSDSLFEKAIYLAAMANDQNSYLASGNLENHPEVANAKLAITSKRAAKGFTENIGV